jgi:FkbM family methyltransferase
MEFCKLIKHAKWHFNMDTELQRSGLRRGTFFRAYCHARLRAYLSNHEAPPVVKPFVVRHGVSGRKATLHIRTDLALSDWITFRGIWAHQDYFHPMINQCRTILDVGTNIGIAAVWLKALIPEAELACIEPDPRNLPLARLNLAENGISAKIFECAIAPYTGRSRLGIEDFYGKSSLENARLYAHSEFVEVQTRRIPEILDDLGWYHVDLLKMDIEGMERDILADGGDWLNRVGLIVLEVHPNTSPEELSNLLQPYGWTLQRLGVHDEETYLAMPSQSLS